MTGKKDDDTIRDDAGFQSTVQNGQGPSLPGPVPDYVAARLRVVRGKTAGETIPLKKAVTVVGRSPASDVKLPDDGISREHFSVSYHPDSREFRVNDLGSSNGTRLNGSIVSSYALRSGDKLAASDTMIVFEVEPAAK
jgi:pSer/pThr/pTyr-binding forkhead associated (FHA) protein